MKKFSLQNLIWKLFTPYLSTYLIYSLIYFAKRTSNHQQTQLCFYKLSLANSFLREINYVHKLYICTNSYLVLWHEDGSDVIVIHLNSSCDYSVSDRFNSHKCLWFFPSQTKLTCNLGINEWLSVETIKQRIYIVSRKDLTFS
jgi:hypothetical protein